MLGDGPGSHSAFQFTPMMSDGVSVGFCEGQLVSFTLSTLFRFRGALSS